ncbi:fungal-specific transcription factor domain-containing protein [Amylocarpus encephaloides]|uniref:Fungal-specific transcription factor domain-containing protein n=1 Tax=Amylocarpus encephaloides TaxID=45428 RepID=A0A9P7YM46_9HELO|nr:fungal-specific transcription factor domain-containing protein [Amylocarpus encephaloides]
MPSIPGYQTVFRVAKPDVSGHLNGNTTPVTRRNRQSVSCLTCRSRKLKCDRQHPCSTCTRRGESDAAACTYSNTTSRSTNRYHTGAPRSSEAHLRLQRLEEMVTNLIQNSKDNSSLGSIPSPGRASTGPSSGPLNETQELIEEPEKRLGRLDVHGSESMFIGPTHWTALLDNIRDIQDALDTDVGQSDEPFPNPLPTQPDIFIGTSQAHSLPDFCKSMPPRPSIDQLVSKYFNAKHNQAPIIHKQKFLREYDSFWSDPSSVPFLWVSILFSVMFIGSSVNVEGPPPEARDFLVSAGHALVAGKYQNGNIYSIEALIFYASCKYIQKEDMESNTWVLNGITARLALRMGYHRDPSTLANITPFEGEMRRRTYFHVEAMDLLMSFKAGLPPVIHENECDTEPPRNLFDTDFDEDCEVLPPSRPTSTPTAMLYYCEKSRLAKFLRRVITHALSLKSSPYEETMKIDSELESAHRAIPASLRIRPLSASFTDQAYLILHRLNVELLYLRSSCILHRKYISYQRGNPAYSYSRKRSVDVGLEILGYQAELHHACQPGGQLYKDRWMPSSLIMYDFLQAVMIVCLDLYESRNETIDREAHSKQYHAVRQAYDIWLSRTSSSRDARRATNVIAAILLKIPKPSFSFDNVHNTAGPAAVIPSRETFALESAYSGPSHDDSLQAFGLYNTPGDMPPLPANYFDGIFDEADNFDWGLMDQRLIAQEDSGGQEQFPFGWHS